MLTREEIINKAKTLAKELRGKSISKRKFIAKTGISEWQINNLFDSWNEVISEAGLTPASNIRLEEDELLQSMFDAFMKAKRVCPRRQFEKFCRYSSSVYYRRFGGWSKALSAFHDWLKSAGRDKEFPYMASLEKQLINKPSTLENSNATRQVKNALSYHPLKGIAYGDFLNFRGLQHAPINEQGVVFLFGMVCSELDYRIEAVKTGFPDCEAKRKIAGRKEQWQRVRIEFEFQSKNFLEHDHKEEDCDVIVCWEHNWPDCPIEVLELKEAIKRLK